MLVEFVAKYWLEVLFTLICSGAAWLVRHHVKLVIADKKRHEKDMIDVIDKKMDEQKADMKEQMGQCYNNLLNVVKESEERSFAEDKIIHKEIDVIKNGMLSLEGRTFKEDCRKLLQEDHRITLAEFEAISAEHDVYNSLGGNHEGDGLFSMVVAKYQNTLKTIEQEEVE